jgi:hypothetical protein
MIGKLLRDPLGHFLAVGLGLFLAYTTLAPDDDAELDAKTVTVDREALLTFIQYRMKAFESDVAARRLDAMTAAELKVFIDDYVREEVLYREALALGLDRDDYVIRRRLVQALDFLAQNMMDQIRLPTEEEVRTYYEANREDYREEATVTFTHVFFDGERRGRAEAAALAGETLGQLNAAKVPFSAAVGYGDRFLYHVNYVERTPDFVASHFGKAMAAGIMAGTPANGVWRGPFQSPYGSHLVLFAAQKAARLPPLAEIEDRVRADAGRALAWEAKDAAIRAIIDTYDVRIEVAPPERGTARDEVADLAE